MKVVIVLKSMSIDLFIYLFIFTILMFIYDTGFFA